LYDGAGQRVSKTTGAGQTTFVYDAFGQLAAEYAGGTVWKKDYVRAGGQIAAIENASGAPCTTCYLSYDFLGSVRMVTDQSANVIARHDYAPFGQEIQAGVGPRTSLWGGSDNVNQKFTGQERDGETNLDFFQARYLSSGLGRFVSPDPHSAGAALTNPQSWNGYAYVLNNPLTATDPSGASPCNILNGTYEGSGTDPCYDASQHNPGPAESPTSIAGAPGGTATGSMIGYQSPDIGAGEAAYLNNVRSVVGWVAGDDPLYILGYLGSEPLVQAATRAVKDIAANGVSGSCAALLQRGDINPNAIQSAAARTQVFSATSNALAYMPLGLFDTSPVVPGVYMNQYGGTVSGSADFAITSPALQVIVWNPSPGKQPPTALQPSVMGIAIHELIHAATGISDPQMNTQFGTSAATDFLTALFMGGGCN
jgi:RHS repeat-associated protein